MNTDEKQWNKLYDLCTDGLLPSPYAELIAYDGETLHNGHMAFFCSHTVLRDLAQVMPPLLSVLRGRLKQNLEKAYRAFSEYDALRMEEDALGAILDECDAVFRANESEITDILREYARTIKL